MAEQLYKYRCGNNKDPVGRHRLRWKGRKCRLLAWAKMNTRFIQFIDDGELLSCSGNALRKVNG